MHIYLGVKGVQIVTLRGYCFCFTLSYSHAVPLAMLLRKNLTMQPVRLHLILQAQASALPAFPKRELVPDTGLAGASQGEGYTRATKQVYMPNFVQNRLRNQDQGIHVRSNPAIRMDNTVHFPGVLADDSTAVF